MPTKNRRPREQEWRVAQQELNPTLSFPLPDHLAAFASDGTNEFSTGLPGGGLVVWVEDDYFFHENIGKGGNDMRQADRRDAVKQLKRDYPGLWGKRGKARVIALKEGLSERTVRRYFRDLQKSGQAKGGSV